MLQKTFIIISILFLNLKYSQNLDKLDIKNGFRNFILGSSPNNIKNLNLKG